EDHEIDRVLLEAPQGLLAVPGLYDLESLVFEGVREELLDRLLVVDEEDRRAFRHGTKDRHVADRTRLARAQWPFLLNAGGPARGRSSGRFQAASTEPPGSASPYRSSLPRSASASLSRSSSRAFRHRSTARRLCSSPRNWLA